VTRFAVYLTAVISRHSLNRIALLLSLYSLAAGAMMAARHRVLFNRFRMPEIRIFIADADGGNQRPVGPHADSEYSPSLSPDGQWIVYTAERGGESDIWRVRPDGTGLEQLTQDPAFDDQGTLSPDGKSLAFVSTRAAGNADIWLLDLAHRKYTNLTHSDAGNFRPRWSPDGQWIAFSSDRDADAGVFPGQWELLQSTGIYIVHPDGTGLRRLTRQGGFAGSPEWSPDGKSILFYETDETGAYLAKSGRSRTEIVSVEVATGKRHQYTASNEIKLSPQWLSGGRIAYIVRAAGGDDKEGLKIRNPDRTVVNLVQGAVRHPSWSADQKHFVFERILHPATTEHLLPTVSRDPNFELVLSEPFPSFSPDGAHLVYSEYGGPGTNTSDTRIQIMNPDGSAERTLFHRDGLSAFDAVWSPSGDVLAFCVGRYFRQPGYPASQIALINPDGSGFRTVADDGMNNGFPSWSPDGKKIVYKRGKQLVILSLADKKLTTLTDGSHYDNFPQWSPKGDVIMFTSDREGERFRLYTIRPDGSDVRRISSGPGSDAHSIWSNDGEWIVFSSGRKGFKDEMALSDSPQPYGEIFAMRADGSGVTQLTDNKWEDASAGWMPEVTSVRK
jgi:TolB protein